MNEEWKDIKGYEELYKISNYGRVYSAISNKCLKSIKNTKGYLLVHLYKDGNRKVFKIHRLVAIHFIPNENKKYNQVNHIDGDKTNNIVNNLEWVDNSLNEIHAYKNGLKGSKSVSKRVRCVETGEEFESIISASRKFKIDRRNITNSCNGETKNTKGLHFEWI